MTHTERAGAMIVFLLRRAITLLEYDAASYDLTARFTQKKSFRKTMRARERERRQLVKQARAALAKVKA